VKEDVVKLIARDVMNRSVRTVRDDRSASELAAFLIEHDISGAPVVDAAGRLVGVVTEHDLTEQRSESGESGPLEGWRGRMNREDLAHLHGEGEGLLVRDVMTPTVYTVPEDLTVAEIARTMVAGRVHRLFVTRAGRLVGMISALDLLKLLCEEPRLVPAERALAE
jgi:CBS domain-containing protein